MLALLWPCYMPLVPIVYLSLPARSLELTPPFRDAINITPFLQLEDESGYWLWGDSTHILSDYDTLKLPARSTGLTVVVR